MILARWFAKGAAPLAPRSKGPSSSSSSSSSWARASPPCLQPALLPGAWKLRSLSATYSYSPARSRIWPRAS